MTGSKNDPPTTWSWAIGPVRIELRRASLLDASERVWVNSEQSDFVLAHSKSTISGSLRARSKTMPVELLV